MSKKSFEVGPRDEILVGDHKGVAIYLRPLDRRFTILDKRFNTKFHDSYEQATTAIDRELQAETKLKLAHLKVELPVLTEEGHAVTIIGINRNDSSALLKETTKHEFSRFYPVEPWVREALTTRAKLTHELKVLDRQLDPLAVTTSRYYGGRIAAEHYEEKIEALKQNLAEAAKRAKRSAPK